MVRLMRYVFRSPVLLFVRLTARTYGGGKRSPQEPRSSAWFFHHRDQLPNTEAGLRFAAELSTGCAELSTGRRLRPQGYPQGVDSVIHRFLHRWIVGYPQGRSALSTALSTTTEC